MSVYTDYGYATEEIVGTGLGILGAFAAIGVIIFVLSMIISIIMIIALWRIFTKLGKPGWVSLIPFYNTWVLFETQGIKGWLSLIPFVNFIFMYIAYYKVAISLGRSKGFAICTIFFPFICLPILGFSKQKKENNNTFDAQSVINAQTNTTQTIDNIVVSNVVTPVVPENIVPQQVEEIQPVAEPSTSIPVTNTETIIENATNVSEETVQTNTTVNVVEQNVDTMQNSETQSIVYCSNCGSSNPNSSMFCSNCGNKLK